MAHIPIDVVDRAGRTDGTFGDEEHDMSPTVRMWIEERPCTTLRRDGQSMHVLAVAMPNVNDDHMPR